ncbi:hypothetical protein glysoja_044125 [Glycine soja]|uniref:Uncharacterized protein n=1 Tax=Glycine soja TaxID=3848 RepID=A0A0B2QSB2_GLYSO|nr:hypothetical protein glysoja_044125 [Glycine soja]
MIYGGPLTKVTGKWPTLKAAITKDEYNYRRK